MILNGIFTISVEDTKIESGLSCGIGWVISFLFFGI